MISLNIESKKENKENKEFKYAIYLKKLGGLFVLLSLVFALCITPLMASQNNPNRNLRFIEIRFVNKDNGFVGEEVINWAKKLKNTSGDFFKIQIVNSNTLSDEILDNVAWAGVLVNENATSNLLNSLQNGCENSINYNPENAITLFWDEGRSFNTANKVFGFLTSSLPLVSQSVATRVLFENITNTNLCLQRNSSQVALLTNPISFKNVNLTPVASVSPVGTISLSVGNILMAVFSSLMAVNLVWNIVGPMPDKSNLERSLIRAVYLCFLPFGLAIVFSTSVVGFASVGSGEYLYNSEAWAQLFATQWTHGLVWSFGIASLFFVIPAGLTSLTFAFLLCCNIIGGFNVDFADPSFKAFYRIFPFNWSTNIMRKTLYGSMRTYTSQSAGILVMQAVVFISIFFYLGINAKTPRPEPLENKENEDEIIDENMNHEIEEDEEQKTAENNDNLPYETIY